MTVQALLGFDGCIEVMDIGAAELDDTPPYRKLLDQNLAHLNAFDGDERQIPKIRATYGDKATIFSDVLGDGTDKVLHLADPVSGMTSLLQPDPTVLKFFNGFEHIGTIFGTIFGTETVKTKRLDDIAGLPSIDFIKMDIQGSELSVLEHGQRCLQSCIAVQLEMSFICLYQNQPAFGEVDVWMRGQGFLPHCFPQMKRWSIAPTKRDGNIRKPFNQLMEADIVYVRDLLTLASLSDEQLRKLALIAHYGYASYDLCVHAMRALVAHNCLGEDIPLKYLQLVNRENAVPPPMQSWSVPPSFTTPQRPTR